MSSRRTSNQQIREAVLQRFISELERKYNERSNDQLIEKRKLQEMKLFVKLIDPDSDNVTKTTSIQKIMTKIARSIAQLFTLNDTTMLNAILTHTFLTRPSILDNPRFRSRQNLRGSQTSSFLPQIDEQINSTQRTTSRSPSIRQSNDEITPGVWVRGTSFPMYTINTTNITQTPAIQRPSAPPTVSAPTVASIPQTPTQQRNESVQWGYEDTTPFPTLQEPPNIFEEDTLPNTKIRTDKNSLIINGTDKLTSCNNEDNDPDPGPNETILSEDNKKWVETNCHSCQDIATQYNYTQEQWSDLVSIKQLDSKGKFKLSQCISIKYFKESLKRDLITSSERFNRMNFQTIFSIYKLKNKNLPETDLRRGLGTRPTKMLLFLLNLPSVSIYIDLESAYKLVHNKTKELYALPLFGGLRRRVGNLKGSLMEISTNHGQIDGYKIYRLLTKSEIENEMEIDFELQLLTELQSLLQHAYKEDETNTLMISNVINNIINILTGEQSSYY